MKKKLFIATSQFSRQTEMRNRVIYSRENEHFPHGLEISEQNKH